MNIKIKGNNYFIIMKGILLALIAYSFFIRDKFAIFAGVAIFISFFFMEKQFKIKEIRAEGDRVYINQGGKITEFSKGEVLSVEKVRSVITIDAGEGKEISILTKFIKRSDREKLEELITELDKDTEK